MGKLTFKGPPHQIGYEHGRRLKDLVRSHYALLYNLTAQQEGEKGLEKKLKEALPKFETFFQGEFPEVLEEIKGIAEGSKIDYEKVLFMNFFEELDPNEPPASCCTAFGATGGATKDGGVYHAKTSDLSPLSYPYSIPGEIVPDRGVRFLYNGGGGGPGRIGLEYGLNEAGLSVGGASVWKVADCVWEVGVPLIIMNRLVLQNCRNVDEAVDFISSHIIANRGGNIMYADKKGNLAVVEKSRSHQAVRYSEDGLLVCTNNFKHSTMKRHEHPSVQSGEWLKNSELRFNRAIRLLRDMKGSLDREKFKMIIRDHENAPLYSICHHVYWLPNDFRYTCSGVIFEPKALKMNVVSGCPCEGEFVAYKLS